MRPGGSVCFGGLLSDQWMISRFYPTDWRPNGVRLTAHAGDATDPPAPVLQGLLDAVDHGRARIPVGRVCRVDDIAQVHRDMEAGVVACTGVVDLLAGGDVPPPRRRAGSAVNGKVRRGRPGAAPRAPRSSAPRWPGRRSGASR